MKKKAKQLTNNGVKSKTKKIVLLVLALIVSIFFIGDDIIGKN